MEQFFSFERLVIEVLGGLPKKLPFPLIFFLSFSLAKHPLRMISQRMSG